GGGAGGVGGGGAGGVAAVGAGEDQGSSEEGGASHRRYRYHGGGAGRYRPPGEQAGARMVSCGRPRLGQPACNRARWGAWGALLCEDAGMPPRHRARTLLASIVCLSACGDDGGRTEHTSASGINSL